MFFNYTLDQFINYNIFLGYSKSQTIQSSYPFLLGIKKTICFIKLSKSILHCKQNYNFLSHLFNNYGSLWFVLLITYFPVKYKVSYIELLDDITSYFKNLKFRILFLTFKWKPGILTNFQYMRCHKKQIYYLNRKLWHPNAIFQFNILWTPILIKEPHQSGVVGLSIADTNIKFDLNNYIIPGNEKTIISLLFYKKLFINFLSRIFLLQKLIFKF